MSSKAVNWAWELRLENPTTKLVLICIADHAGGDDGLIAWPSLGRISAMTGLCERSVQNAIVKLGAMGIVKKTHRLRDNGSHSSNQYAINLGWVASPAPPAPDAPPPSTTCTLPPAGDAPPEPRRRNVDNEQIHSDEVGCVLEELPEPPEFLDALEVDGGSASSFIEADSLDPKKTPPPSPTPLVDPRLLEIYELYPRKAARPAALRAIKAAVKKVGYDQLKAFVGAYAAHHRANQIEMQFTPMCATWMNQERWADTPVTVTPKAPPVEFGRIQYLRQQISESPAFPGGRYFADHTRPETRETLKRNLEELLRLNPNEDISHLRV